jgi:hypothetical protein
LNTRKPILVMTIAGIKEVEHKEAHIGHDNCIKKAV